MHTPGDECPPGTEHHFDTCSWPGGVESSLRMLFLALAIALLVVCGVLVYLSARDADRRLDTWRATAKKLGLRLEGDREERTMEGRRRGVPIRAHYEQVRQMVGKVVITRNTITLTAGGDGEIPRNLSLRVDTLGLLGRLISQRDSSIGDSKFDDFVVLPELDEYVCAALSSRARELLLQLLRGGGAVRDGVLVLEDRDGSDSEPAWLEQQLELLAELGAELSVLPSSLHRRLAQNASTDPSAGVRLRNLRYLSEPGVAAPHTLLVDTARKLLAEPDLQLHSLAARQLGAEGFPALYALAADAALDTAPRVEALEALGQANAPGLEPLLAELLSQPSAPELTLALLTGVGALGLVSLHGAVLHGTGSPHEGVRAAAVRALGQLADHPAAPGGTEQHLLQLLGDPSDDVQRASAEALGAVGSVRAVEPLLGLTGGLGRAALRQAARGAIAQIQSRLGDVEAGRLSLTDGSLEGAVRLADTSVAVRGGDVSLADDGADEVASGAANKPRSSA